MRRPSAGAQGYFRSTYGFALHLDSTLRVTDHPEPSASGRRSHASNRANFIASRAGHHRPGQTGGADRRFPALVSRRERRRSTYPLRNGETINGMRDHGLGPRRDMRHLASRATWLPGLTDLCSARASNSSQRPGRERSHRLPGSTAGPTTPSAPPRRSPLGDTITSQGRPE